MIEEKKITVEASSLEQALSDASKQLKIPVDELKATVLSQEREGFLGLFGNKKLKVEITAEAKPDLISQGIEFVNSTLKLMDIKAEAVLSDTEKNTLDIQGEDAADYVVGRYGDALKAMEYITNLALRDPKAEPRIKIDSCGYKARRTKSLERLAEATARQAVKFGRPVRLEPMASWERWVIHTTLKNNENVTTESVGEPPMRKVVIMPKYDPENSETAGPATLRIRSRREKNYRRTNRRQRLINR